MDEENEEKYNPKTCGYGRVVYDTIICNVNCTPCALHFSETCYLKKVDKAIIAFYKEAKNEN